MYWNFLLSGDAFASWLMELVPDPLTNPNGRFPKGQKLDPFQTSMRDAKAISGWLKSIRDGGSVQRGGNGKQAYTDLNAAGLIIEEDSKYLLTELGSNVLTSWGELQIDNDQPEADFYRILILALEAKKLSIGLYDDIYKFWSEVRKAGDPIGFILNPESLYLMGLLSKKYSNFCPWAFIRSNNLIFQSSGTIEQLKSLYINNPDVVTRLEKIETWLSNSASRPLGRQRFCLALELIHCEESKLQTILMDSRLSDVRGNLSSQDIKMLSEKYSFGQVASTTNRIGDNVIFYGPPGTGKSTTAHKEIGASTRTSVTFHPATDYASFVGFYKPISKVDENGISTVRYEFQPQHFLRAYVNAWKNIGASHYLLIEEINRGNCAKIFGDVFQLLDRDSVGYSRYFINVDSDISNYLMKVLCDDTYISAIKELYRKKNNAEILDPYSVLILPRNLTLLATMNTSDQSLFPMDSAFKRRWNWKYVGISKPENQIKIQIGDKAYDWFDFLTSVNKKISQITESEDKKLGTYFVTPQNNIINSESFVGKVVFYLWNDIFRDEDKNDENNIFYITNDVRETHLLPVRFSDFFIGDEICKITLQKFMAANNISEV